MPGNILYSRQNKVVTDELSRVATQALITRDRAQKLELLVHLINNLNQPLLLCGADGIGKTTMLKTLADNYSVYWPICSLATTHECSLEIILEQFAQQLQHVHGNSSSQSLANTLVEMQNRNQKAVFIIDNAGLLVPGLITDLIRFAAATPCVRLIFSLTHDELHIKRISDACIDECHFIEIPPLNIKQCAVFLQNLSVQHKIDMPLNSITDALAEQLFRTSHGIPGKIIKEIQLPVNKESSHINYWNMGSIIILGMLITGGVMYLFTPKTQNNAVPAGPKHVVHGGTNPHPISLPAISMPPNGLGQNDVLIGDSFIGGQPGSRFNSNEQTQLKGPVRLTAETQMKRGQSTRQVADDEVNDAAIAKVPPAVQPKQPLNGNESGIAAEAKHETEINSKKEVTAEPEPNARKIPVATAGDADLDWLKKQKPEGYTLQLMVLSNKAAVSGFLKKHPELRKKIRYFTSNQAGQTRYLLIYHAYSSSKDALKAKKKLPKEMRSAWIRSFKALQKQFAAN